MDSPWNVLSRIRATDSKNEKIALIRAAAASENVDFFSGIRYALDNIDTFGVKKVPQLYDAPGEGLSFAEFRILADKLIKRKLTGGAAAQAIDDAMWKATADEWNGWYKPILEKDLKSGFSESSVNKAIKETHPQWVIPTTPYMRCSLPDSSNMDQWDWAEGIYSQLKADGMFAYVNVRADGFVWVTSRGGTLFPDGSLGIEDAAANTFNYNSSNHGELTVYQDGVLLERSIGNGILNSVLKGGSLEPGQIVVYDVWDQIPLEIFLPKGKGTATYKQRYEFLKAQVDGKPSPQVKLIETQIVFSEGDAQKHYRSARNRKLEGTVCKSPHTIWKDGTSKDQVKMKEEVDCELEVVKFNPGNGKNAKTFGSIECKSSCGKLVVNVSGFSDDDRDRIYADRLNWPGKIITGRSNSLLAPSKGKKSGLWSLFLPRFIEERADKTEADSLEKIQAQFKAAEDQKAINIDIVED